jgi:Ca2+:H+ antiporter
MDLVKGSLTGAIVTNSLFMLGGCFFLGGLRHRVQEFNPRNARVQAGMLLLASIALLVPSIVNRVEAWDPAVTQPLSLSISVILLVTYALSALFSLKTHKEFFGSAAGGEDHGTPWPMGLALGALAGSTVFIAVVSEIFVESVQHAAVSFGMSKAFVGFVIVSIVGAAAEMMSAFSAARKNRLDMSVGIAMGSSTQIAMFVAPVLVILSYFIAPAPMDLQFGGGQVIMVLLATLTVSSVVSGGQSAWYSGVQLIAVYAIFAVTLYMIPG